MAACQQQYAMMDQAAGVYAGNGGYAGSGGFAGNGGFVGGAIPGAGAGVATSATGSAGCAGCCDDSGVGGPLNYVGQGRGDWAVQTTYVYVGAGRGDLGHMAPKKNGLAVVVCGVVVLVALVLLAVFMLQPVTTTTRGVEKFSNLGGSTGTCLIYGDPHVESFDGASTMYVDEGEYYLVKTDTISIQALCLATPFTEGLAATHELAVGGSALGGHVIRVGPMENGQILLDGQPALTAFPSSQTVAGVGSLSYNADGELVDGAQGHLEKHVVHISLDSGHLIDVMRWSNHINVRIAMASGSPTDGLCGNFNGQAGDDSAALITARNAAAVPESECLFDHQGAFKPAPAHSIAECKRDTQRYNKAVELCGAAGAALKEGCIFDVCFAGARYAKQIGL
mmetsp:Transcript_83470/g.233856  ORF Transcript_83470/g.233856 Transcript_83470/m.233856 type:complete len:395 (+) Transcript_83470:77-1261(+)